MLALAFALTTVSALRVPGPLSPRNANYRIDARLDADRKELTATEHITWRNPTSAPARELVFHLYMNAFKNQASAFWRESHGRLRRTEASDKDWGAIDMTRLVVAGTNLTKAITVDDTLAHVPLPKPVEAGGTVEIDVTFTTLLPKVFARTGHHDDFFAIAQWFPKLGVWDCDDGGCRWRAHQHHASSEFFADYGTYDVSLDAPKRFVVAASGVPVEDPDAKGDRKRWRFHAEDVHDFALFACPRFVVHEVQVQDALGAVDVLFYGIPGHQANVPRHFSAVRAGLDELEPRLGPYPSARLSVIDIPAGTGMR